MYKEIIKWSRRGSIIIIMVFSLINLLSGGLNLVAKPSANAVITGRKFAAFINGFFNTATIIFVVYAL